MFFENLNNETESSLRGLNASPCPLYVLKQPLPKLFITFVHLLRLFTIVTDVVHGFYVSQTVITTSFDR